MSNKKLFAPFLMLLAGAVVSIVMFLSDYDMTQRLTILLLSMLFFYCVGLFIQKKMVKFLDEIQKKEETQKAEEGEVIEKEAKKEEAEKEEKYQTKVLPMNLEQMKKEDIYEIIKSVLMEFPISSIGFYVPRWTEMLKKDHPLKMELLQMARDVITEKTTMRDIYEEQEKEYEYITGQKLESVAMDSGEVVITVKVGDVYYYEFLSETTGMEIRNEYEFIKIMGELAKKKKEYEEVGEALAAVKQRGYGVVTPTKEEIVLEEPQIVKHGSKYGVKIKASAPSIHMIRANISTEIAPIVGEEYQAKDLMDYIEQGSNQPGESMWDVNIFGKTLEQLVGDGMQTKALKMTDESQQKLQDTMEKIINESNGGLVCIII